MASRSAIHELEATERRGRWFVALASLLSIAVLLSTWMGFFTFLGTNAAYASFERLENKYLPDVEGQVLRLPDLSRVSRVYSSDGTLLAELHDGRVSEPVRYEDLPDQVVYAVLAAEDSDFFEHDGVDFSAIVSAAIDNLAADTQRGGSTITQQVVKNEFVGDAQTYQRKIEEALTAIELERRFTKEQILEFYVNSVYFGSSAYGVSAAAQEFFATDLDNLTLAQAATIAVLPRNPTLYDPRRQPTVTEQRRNDVIDEMAQSGFISVEMAEEAKAEPFVIAEPQEFTSPADHVVAEVRRQLLNDPRFAFLGATKEERKIRIFGCPADDETCEGGGGLDITLTIDLDLQIQANEILQSWMPPSDDPDNPAPTGAIATVDNVSGAVLVMASGLPFEQEQFDLATQGRRNPGSAFKPFTLVAALESGISMNSYWDATSPKEIECPYTCSARGNVWNVSNAGGGSGLIRLFDATRSSVNVVYAQVALDVGPERIADTAHRMGIESELTPVPSITLGTSSVSPLEMASAYSNFATNGVWAEPYLVQTVTSRDGQVNWEHSVNPIQTVDPAIIAAARQPLELVPTGSGTAPRANLDGNWPQGGKTGTHQSFREAWFVGFVPQYSTAVWVGFPDEQRELRNVVINGENRSRVFGGTVPAPIWKQFMEILLADVEPIPFPDDPQGTASYFFTPTTTVPLVVGLTRQEATEDLLNAHVRPTVIEVASLEPKDTVLSQSVDPGTEVSQGAPVEIEVSSGIPPVVALPDLTLKTVAEAIDILRTIEAESGVILSLEQITQPTADPNLVGKILAQTPAPGSSMQTGSLIRVVVGVEAPDDD